MGYTILSNVAVKELASKMIRENIVQKVLPIPGKGFDGRWSEDLDAAVISIQRTKGSNKGGRAIGETTNGGFANTQKSDLQSQVTDVKLNIVFDACTDVPENALKMNGANLLDSILRNIPKDGAKTINCSYFATLIARAIDGNRTLSTSVNYTAMAAATAAGAMDALNAAFAHLLEGDADNGFDIFNQDFTQLYMTADFGAKLRGNAGIFTGNYIGQSMMASGSFSALDKDWTPNSVNGYVGEINGAAAVYVGSLFTTANGWLCKRALSDGTKTAVASGSLAHLAAILVGGEGVVGAIDNRSEVKVVDLQGASGYQVQPLVRCGWEVFSPKAVQLIADATGLTASAFVTTADGTVTHVPDLLPPGNRS